MSDDLAFSRSQQRTIRWLRLSIALAVILPTALFVGVAWQRYQQITVEQTRNTDRIARIMSEHALKLFDTNEVMLERLLELVDDASDAEIRRHEAELHRKVSRMVEKLPQVQSVWVLNRDGHPLVTNRYLPAPTDLDLSDRPSFLWHKAGHESMFITGALLGRRTGDLFFDLTRRRSLADGSFAGTVQVSLYPAYLVDFYRTLAAKETGFTLTLFRKDGQLIARWPEATRPDSRLMPDSAVLPLLQRGETSGTIRARSSIDDIERIYTFHRVGPHEVYASAGIALPALRALWWREMLVIALFAFPSATALILISLVALRKTRRELEAANRLQQESLQRQQVEEVLRQTQKMEALGHLTGGVAHDFNNLLMIVEMNAHFLEQTQPGLRQHPRLEAIRRAVGTGTKLTRQLLSFSRRQPLVAKTLSLQHSLPALLELCRHVLTRDIQTELVVAPDTPPISIDVAELELAMINLAVNARHAMPEGGHFTVEARPVRPADGGASGAACASADRPTQVEIRVRDTGVGIPAELVERVFEPFFTTKPAGSGTGLGLSQVHNMCTRLGGSARIESLPGAGTTVIMQLPAATGTAAGAHEAQPLPTRLGYAVLLVEDNDDIVSVVQPTLELAGCRVRRCGSGDEALRWLGASNALPDVVLSDIAMPGDLSGIDLAKALRGRHPTLPVVLMTGFAERLADAEQLGLPVLPKPFSAAALIATLHQAVTTRSADVAAASPFADTAANTATNTAANAAAGTVTSTAD